MRSKHASCVTEHPRAGMTHSVHRERHGSLTPDLRADSRRLEMELFGPRRKQAAETSRRAGEPTS